MKIIEPSVELVDDFDAATIMKKIERAGRVCYKSEGNIKADSAEKRGGGETALEVVERGEEGFHEVLGGAAGPFGAFSFGALAVVLEVRAQAEELHREGVFGPAFRGGRGFVPGGAAGRRHVVRDGFGRGFFGTGGFGGGGDFFRGRGGGLFGGRGFGGGIGFGGVVGRMLLGFGHGAGEHTSPPAVPQPKVSGHNRLASPSALWEKDFP